MASLIFSNPRPFSYRQYKSTDCIPENYGVAKKRKMIFFISDQNRKKDEFWVGQSSHELIVLKLDQQLQWFSYWRFLVYCLLVNNITYHNEGPDSVPG